MLKKITIEMLVDAQGTDADLKEGLENTLNIPRRDKEETDDCGCLEANIITITIEDCNKPISPFRVVK